MKCPNCNSDRAHRSHRRSWKDYLGSLLGWYPYRCKCGHRFLKRRHSMVADGGELRQTEKEIRATRAVARRAMKRREVLLFGGALLVFATFLYYLTRERAGSSDAN